MHTRYIRSIISLFILVFSLHPVTVQAADGLPGTARFGYGVRVELNGADLGHQLLLGWECHQLTKGSDDMAQAGLPDDEGPALPGCSLHPRYRPIRGRAIRQPRIDEPGNPSRRRFPPTDHRLG